MIDRGIDGVSADLAATTIGSVDTSPAYYFQAGPRLSREPAAVVTHTRSGHGGHDDPTPRPARGIANSVITTERAQAVPRFFLLEDNPAVGRGLTLLLAPHGDVTLVQRLNTAMTVVDGFRQWSALFIDVLLPDGNGLDVLAFARSVGCSCPALVLTALHDHATIKRAFSLDARYLLKPADPAAITSFAIDCAARRPSPSSPTRRRALRERQYLAAFAEHGGNKTAVARALGVTRQAVQRFVARRPDLVHPGLIPERGIPATKKLR